MIHISHETSPNKWEGFLPVQPIPKGRPRMTRRGGVYTPQKTRDAEEDIKYWLLKKRAPSFEGRIGVYLVFNIQKAKTSRLQYPTSKCDIDNLAKLVLDACNETLYEDDGQIVFLMCEKRFAETAGISITIWEIA